MGRNYLPRYAWGTDTHPATPLNRTIIYEAHVKGMTTLCPDVSPAQRGTYAGFGHPSVIAHLKRVGVTAVEFLLVQQFIKDEALDGRSNYWGYNPIGYFAPHNAYAAACGAGEPAAGPPRPGGQVTEIKDMVKALHSAGIEVILDVVYNHSGEGGADGPNLCFRGIDNGAYYHLVPGDEANYEDYTGTGNTLDVGSPTVLRLVMDSLHYWVEEIHVDGFRFDLAPALARASDRDVLYQTPTEYFPAEWEVALTSWDGPAPGRMLARTEDEVPARTTWILRSVEEERHLR